MQPKMVPSHQMSMSDFTNTPVIHQASLNHHSLTPIALPPPPPPPPVISVAENKIYHCTNCQQLFLKLSVFKKHQCIILSNNLDARINSENVAIKEMSQINPHVQQQQPHHHHHHHHQKHIESNSKLNDMSLLSQDVETSNDLNVTNSITNSAPSQNKRAHLTRNELFSSGNLLKHPLVVKTLLEIYNVSTLDELSALDASDNIEKPNLNKNFYMCSSCGYRGNTVRGVKQHGKSHLQEKEHFGIINTNEKLPLLVYYSLNDNELHISSKKTAPMPSSLTVLSQDMAKSGALFHSPTKSEHSEEELDEEETFKTFPSAKKSDINSSSGIAKLLQDCQHKNQHPISKKARLLDAHHKMQDSLTMESREQVSAAKKQIDKSQTYCFKCNIQFQKVANYLAHKTNYCKDD